MGDANTFLNKLHPEILKQVETSLLNAQNFIFDCKARRAAGNSVIYEEFREKLVSFGLQEFYVNDDLEYFLPTSIEDLYVSLTGEQVVFETEIYYCYDRAEHDNAPAYTAQFSAALDARKAYDRELGWKSNSIDISKKKYSRAASFEEVERMLKGEMVITHPVVVNPNTLEYEWTEEEIAENEAAENEFWSREIDKQNAEIADWGEIHSK